MRDAIGQAAIQACFERKYRPYGRALDDGAEAIDVAQNTVDGACQQRLEEASDAALGLQLSSEGMRAAFAEGDFNGTQSEEFAGAFTEYRSTMDTALLSCVTAAGSDETADPIQSETPAPEEQDLYDAAAAEGLAIGAADVARYCLRRVGAGSAGNSHQARRCDARRTIFIELVQNVVENYPSIDIAGTPLREWLSHQVDDARSSSCDPKLAAAIEAELIKLPYSSPSGTTPARNRSTCAGVNGASREVLARVEGAEQVDDVVHPLVQSPTSRAAPQSSGGTGSNRATSAASSAFDEVAQGLRIRVVEVGAERRMRPGSESTISECVIASRESRRSGAGRARRHARPRGAAAGRAAAAQPPAEILGGDVRRVERLADLGLQARLLVQADLEVGQQRQLGAGFGSVSRGASS